MGITRPNPPTLEEIGQQREELLTQVDLPSQHSTSPADPDPASPPIAALPTPEPLPLPALPQPPLHQQQAPAPQHSRLSRLAVGQSVFDKYALYGLAGEAVRTLAPHTEAQPEET